jgi:pimeloyl-ACP methyl ester carboxylesterase
LTDTEDIILWINKIVDEDKDASIFLFGVGAGGTAVMSVCDEKLPENVKAIIEDSGYDTFKDVYKNNIEKYYNKKSFPSLLIANIYVESKYGWSISDISLRDQVHNSNLPILFIHGGEDVVVPVNHSNEMYEVCPAVGTDHLLISSATHCRAMQTKPEKYWRIVDEFIVGQMG